MLTAKSIMCGDVLTIAPEARLVDAIDTLLSSDANSLIVIDHSGHVMGVITEFALLAATYDPAIRDEPVSAHMTENVVSIHEQATLTQIADLIILHRVHQLPVLRDGILVGLVTRRELLRASQHSQFRAPAAAESLQA
ncbi:MAG: CBS domain-containing protein [Pirellulales bacterium]